MSSNQSHCADINGLGKYQYIVYALLGSGVIASEWLGLTKYVKPNTIVEAVIWIVKNFIMNGGGDKNARAPIKKPDEEDVEPNAGVSVVLSSN